MYLLSFVIWQIHADRDRLHVQAAGAICFYQGTPASDQKEPVILQRGRAVTNVKLFCLRCRTVSEIREQKAFPAEQTLSRWKKLPAKKFELYREFRFFLRSLEKIILRTDT